MGDTCRRNWWRVASTVEWGIHILPYICQDMQKMQKDQPLQGSVQVNAETAARPETAKEWQINPCHQGKIHVGPGQKSKNNASGDLIQ